MLRLAAIGCIFTSLAFGQLWSGVIDPSRAVDWTSAGISGGIPSASWAQSGSVIAAYGSSGSPASASTINTAISSCGTNHYVQLGAGTFYLNTNITLQSNCELRGMGGNQTFLIFISVASSLCYGEVIGMEGSCQGPGFEGNVCDWSAGYSSGISSITLANCGSTTPAHGSLANLKLGTVLVLDQLDEVADPGTIWNCAANTGSNICANTTPAGFERQDGTCNGGMCTRSQQQSVTVTGISGSTITISPGLYMPNWRLGQLPQAWFPTTTITNTGITNLSIDTTSAALASTAPTIVINNCSQCWVSGVRSIDAFRSHIRLMESEHSIIRNNYFYLNQASGTSSYGVEVATAGDNLIENNIFQQVPDNDPSCSGACFGNVFSYNFTVLNTYAVAHWMQANLYDHSAGTVFNLWEGNIGPGFTADDVHGTHHFETLYRNYLIGQQSNCDGVSCTDQTVPVNLYAGSRYINVIGNVLGTSSYHTGYQCVALSTGSCSYGQASSGKDTEIFALGYTGNGAQQDATLSGFCSTPSCGSNVTYDTQVSSYLFRWGNYDTVTAAVRWCGNSGDPGWSTTCALTSEVPTGIASYSNAVPNTTTLPSSLYYSATPSWWPSGKVWPVIGPDVSAGNISNVGGFANSNPAMDCYLNVMSGPSNGSGSVLSFNSASCYPSSTKVYLRDGLPTAFPAAQISGSTTASGTLEITATGHGFASTCGTSTTCYASISGVVSDGGTGTCPSYNTTLALASAQYADGIRTVKYVDPNQVLLYDATATPIGNALSSTGAYCSGESFQSPHGASWIAAVSPYNIPAANLPGSWLGPINGPTYQALALSTQNGLTATNGLSLSGCPSACVATVTTTASYNPLTVPIPVANGQKFSIFGTGTILDSTNASSCAGAGTVSVPLPYTVNTVSSTGWTSAAFACSLSNGDYTAKVATCGPPATPNDTLGGGSLPCTVVSQIAYHGNAQWDYFATIRAASYLDAAGNNYKVVMDGGTYAPNSAGQQNYANVIGVAAVAFAVDLTNANLFRDIQYYIQNPEVEGGVSWTINELVGSGGNLDQQDAAYVANQGVGAIAGMYLPYAATATQITFLNKEYNTVSDPGNQCSKSGVEFGMAAPPGGETYYGVVASGTTSSAPTSTNVQLPSCGSIVATEMIGFGNSSALATAVQNIAANGTFAFVSSCTGGLVTFMGTPVGTLPVTTGGYAVFATATWSSAASGAAATVTLVGTTYAALGLAATDAIAPGNTWQDINHANMLNSAVLIECKITGGSGTSVSCTNGSSVPSGVTSTPFMVWHIPHISVSSSSLTSSIGMCGHMWSQDHAQYDIGAQPALFPETAGDGGTTLPYAPNQFPSIATTRWSQDLALAFYDSRANVDASRFGTIYSDFAQSPFASYVASGAGNNGSQYSNWINQYLAVNAALTCENFASFPPCSQTSTPFLSDQAFWKMYSPLPDWTSAGTSGRGQPICIGGDCSNSFLAPASLTSAEQMFDAQWVFSPISTTAQYLLDFLTNYPPTSLLSAPGYDNGVIAPLLIDPRSGSGGATAASQPYQYLFNQTSNSLVASLTGVGSPNVSATLNGLMMISHDGWSKSSGGNPSSTHTFARAAGNLCGAGHDNFGAEAGIYKLGWLEKSDLGSATAGGGGYDMSVHGEAMNFTGYGNSQWATCPNTSQRWWWSDNRGSWASNYGDQNSQLVTFAADVGASYASGLNVGHCYNAWTHAKGTSEDEFWVRDDDCFLTSGTSLMQHRWQFPQNGAAPASPDQPYNTGTTSCINAAGSSATCLLTNFVETLECTGVSCPPTQYGMITGFHSPNSVTFNDDGSAYSGGFGDAHAYTISASGASKYEVRSCGIVMQATNYNTLFTFAGVDPDTNWSGCMMTGPLSGLVHLAVRGTATQGTVTAFSTATLSASIPIRYHFSGLSAGSYTVNVAGTNYGPYTVSTGSNTLTLKAAAPANGTITLNAATVTPSSVSHGGVAGPGVVIHEK